MRSGSPERIRTLIWPGHELSYLRPDGGFRQSAGLYRARLQVSGLAPKGGRPPHLTLFSKELDRMIFEADVLAPEKKPVILEFETFLPAGKFDILINNSVPGPSNSPRSGRPGGFVFTTLDDPKSRAPGSADDGRRGEPALPVPHLRLDRMGRPDPEAGGSPQTRNILPSRKGQPRRRPGYTSPGSRNAPGGGR